MADSVTIGGTAIKIRPFSVPSIKRAILWTQSASGAWSGSDRGASQDIYTSTIKLQTTDSSFNSIQTVINNNRSGITLSAFNTDVFAPTVDQTGSVSATVTDFGEREHFKFAGASSGIFDLSLSIRAISPSLLSPTPSLSSLRLKESWIGDKTTDINKSFTYNQNAFYSDRNADIGRFVGNFSQTTTELKSILAYIMVTARANTITMPTLAGASYPFGISKGNGAFNVKIYDFSFTRVNLNRWSLMIDFREVA